MARGGKRLILSDSSIFDAGYKFPDGATKIIYEQRDEMSRLHIPQEKQSDKKKVVVQHDRKKELFTTQDDFNLEVDPNIFRVINYLIDAMNDHIIELRARGILPDLKVEVNSQTNFDLLANNIQAFIRGHQLENIIFVAHTIRLFSIFAKDISDDRLKLVVSGIEYRSLCFPGFSNSVRKVIELSDNTDFHRVSLEEFIRDNLDNIAHSDMERHLSAQIDRLFYNRKIADAFDGASLTKLLDDRNLAEELFTRMLVCDMEDITLLLSKHFLLVLQDDLEHRPRKLLEKQKDVAKVVKEAVMVAKENHLFIEFSYTLMERFTAFMARKALPEYQYRFKLDDANVEAIRCADKVRADGYFLDIVERTGLVFREGLDDKMISYRLRDFTTFFDVEDDCQLYEDASTMSDRMAREWSMYPSYVYPQFKLVVSEARDMQPLFKICYASLAGMKLSDTDIDEIIASLEGNPLREGVLIHLYRDQISNFSMLEKLEKDLIGYVMDNYLDRITTTYKSLENPHQDHIQIYNLILEICHIGLRDNLIEILIDNSINPLTDIIANIIFKNPELHSTKFGNPSLILIHAFDREQLDTIKTLLSYPEIDYTYQDSAGRTILHRATSENYLEIVKTILTKSKKSINAQDTYGNTALIIATNKGHTDIAILLIDKGTDIKLQNKLKDTALIISAYEGYTQVVQTILKKSTNSINIQNNNNDTALIIATYKGHTDIAILLIAKGAKVDLKK